MCNLCVGVCDGADRAEWVCYHVISYHDSLPEGKFP